MTNSKSKILSLSMGPLELYINEELNNIANVTSLLSCVPSTLLKPSESMTITLEILPSELYANIGFPHIHNPCVF